MIKRLWAVEVPDSAFLKESDLEWGVHFCLVQQISHFTFNSESLLMS